MPASWHKGVEHVAPARVLAVAAHHDLGHDVDLAALHGLGEASHHLLSKLELRSAEWSLLVTPKP